MQGLVLSRKQVTVIGSMYENVWADHIQTKSPGARNLVAGAAGAGRQFALVNCIDGEVRFSTIVQGQKLLYVRIATLFKAVGDQVGLD